MKERFSHAAVLAFLSRAEFTVSARSENIDFRIDCSRPSFGFRVANADLQAFSFRLPDLGSSAISDIYPIDDKPGSKARHFAGPAVFPGIGSRRVVDCGAFNTSSPLYNIAGSSAQNGSGAGGSTATGRGEASPSRTGGAYAGLFSVDGVSGSGGGSGGAPAPEINALPGLALAGGTVTYFRRGRRERSDLASALRAPA